MKEKYTLVSFRIFERQKKQMKKICAQFDSEAKAYRQILELGMETFIKNSKLK